MNELIAAAKAVIADWNRYHGVHFESVNMLSAAVERAEKPPTCFVDWFRGKLSPTYYETWTAAQQAERERIRARVYAAANKTWQAGEAYIGPPHWTLQQFVEELLRGDEAEANARLIAAAPDLLDFAKWIISLKTDGGIIDDKARSLVQKVEGDDAAL